MENRIQAFGETVGKLALARNWVAVHGLLAPWLRSRIDVEGVRAFFEDDYQQTLRARDVAGEHYPEVYEVSGNSSSLADLRDDEDYPRAIPEEVTEAAFRQWLKLQLQCSEAQANALNFDYFTEVWAIVVEIDEGLRIGYWSHSPY